ncbi:MAG: DNA gyrase inhibitor YacG [Burkholderiales bacterium]
MKPRLVACPLCGKPSPYNPDNRYRPFCSERCKLIDLGQWASESYSVASNETPDSPDAPTESDHQ